MVISVDIVAVTNDEDIRGVVALADEIWREHYQPIIGMEQIEYMLQRFQSFDAISSQISLEGYNYYLMEIVTPVTEQVGYFSFQRRRDEMFLSKIYVRSNRRKLGYGKRALEHIEAGAGKNGISKISLTVNKKNRLAIEAYHRYGFTIERSLVQDIGNGFVMDDFVMVKPLAP